MDYTPKRVGEELIIAVDYVRFLKDRPGVTVSTATWRNKVAFGIDASPMSMIQGIASITGSVVSTKLIGGVADVGYYPQCDAILSNGEKVTLPDIGDGLLVVRT